MFWNLHIFIGVQQICHLAIAKRKVNIPIFTIWISHGPSVPEVISGRSHTSLSVFRVLRQFRDMVKRSQIMGMNKRKVLQNLHVYILHPNWPLSNSKSVEAWVLPFLGWLGHFERLWTQVSQIKSKNT